MVEIVLISVSNEKRIRFNMSFYLICFFLYAIFCCFNFTVQRYENILNYYYFSSASISSMVGMVPSIFAG